MKRLFLLFGVLLSGLGVVGKCQTLTLAPSFCSSYLGDAAKSCGSFKELFDNDDSELLAMLRSGTSHTSYVCFDETEDRLLVVSFSLPSVGGGSLAYDEYRKGRRESNHRRTDLQWYPPLGREDHTFPAGWWMPPQGELAGKYVGTHVAVQETVATIDAAEISVTYSFLIKSGGMTHYELAIRRSTQRFTETFESVKGGPIEEVGHCALFGQKQMRRGTLAPIQ